MGIALVFRSGLIKGYSFFNRLVNPVAQILARLAFAITDQVFDSLSGADADRFGK